MSADTTPTLFDSDAEKLQARVEELEADLESARSEATRLNDLYVRYQKEASGLTDRTRATLRREAWAAVHSTDVFNQSLIGEIQWLRLHITQAGRALHRQFGHTDGTQCDCRGCELIVATDLRDPSDASEGELAPRTDLQQRLIAAETERDQARNALAAYKALSPKPERSH